MERYKGKTVIYSFPSCQGLSILSPLFVIPPLLPLLGRRVVLAVQMEPGVHFNSSRPTWVLCLTLIQKTSFRLMKPLHLAADRLYLARRNWLVKDFSHLLIMLAWFHCFCVIYSYFYHPKPIRLTFFWENHTRIIFKFNNILVWTNSWLNGVFKVYQGNYLGPNHAVTPTESVSLEKWTLILRYASLS